MDKIFQLVFSLPTIALFTLAGDVFAQGRAYEWGHGPGMMGWGYGIGWFGPLLTIVFWIAVVVGVVFLIRWLALSTRAGSHGTTSGESALEILKKRYARGEINKEEFEEKRKDLT